MIVAYGFWLLVLSLWWAIAHDGTQGFSPGMGLIGILALPLLFWKRPTFSMDAIILLVLLIWVIATSFWSPAEGGSMIFEPKTGVWSLESDAFRVGITTLGFTYGYWALHQLDDKAYGRAVWAARIGLGIQAALLIGWLLAFDVFMNYGLSKTSAGELRQNMGRIINLSAIMIPVFVASLPIRNLLIKGVIYALVFVGLFLIARRPEIDSQSAILALLAGAIAIGGGFLFGRQVFRVLGYLTAGLIMTIPALFLALVRFTEGKTADLPISFQSRLESYSYVIDRIGDRIFFGWGLGASATWDDEFIINVPGIGPVEYMSVPGHPHNGSLHIWAETGIIGALLLSGFVILLGERLARTASHSRELNAASAAVWAGALVMACFSYSLFNDAFWGAILLASTMILALSKVSSQRTAASS